ncbi:hypothetical protein PHLCEN_2v13405 [Hermanssonia centrifuga]|uniref:YDG domain-containing protein n=1 Tax=Hermanssonia centrifuga TaxID=98765 RepID=A0A2R6NFD6_9APHY|nr:hypothetical protein PHLCEN_2v13405 [Hermanssonia centrifuga]
MSDNALSQTIRRRDPKEFGPLKGLTVGDTWETRRECSSEKVHPPIEKGIYGDKDGARSIVISGGYEDDVDEGDTMFWWA